MRDIEQLKDKYIKCVYDEMRRRGYKDMEIPQVIEKTGFMSVICEYPEEQLHCSIEDAVDEIIFVEASNSRKCTATRTSEEHAVVESVVKLAIKHNWSVEEITTFIQDEYPDIKVEYIVEKYHIVRERYYENSKDN